MTSVNTNVLPDHSLLDFKSQLEYIDEPPYSINNSHILQYLQCKDSNNNIGNIENNQQQQQQKQRHSLLSSSSLIDHENIHILDFLNFATLSIDLNKRAQISQQILEDLENIESTLSSTTLPTTNSIATPPPNSNSSSASSSSSPLHSYIFAYATLLQCSTKVSINHNEQVVYLLNRAEYKLRNAITSCEMNRELALDFVLQAELHFLLARVLFELSFPRSDELERESAVMAAMSQPIGMKTATSSTTSSQSISTSSPIQIGSNNSPKETFSAPGVIGSYYGTSVGMSHSLSSDNFMALSLDSPLRNSSYGSPNSNSHPNLKQGSGSPSFSPRGNTSQKAAQQAQQQVDSIFQDICLHMDSAIKFFEKSTVKRKKKVDQESEENTPVDIIQESKRAYMNMYFGDVLTQWSVRRKQRWAALCSRAQEKYNISIKICIDKILPSLNREKTICINTRGVEQFTDNQCIYSPLHHQCLYKYSVLLLYWVRRKREHTTIYSGDANSGDVNLASFDYDSTMVAVDSIGEIEATYSEIRPNALTDASSPSGSTPETSQKGNVPRHAQSIFKNSVATDAEKLCKACVKLWECVCELEERKSKAFQAIPEHTINPHYYFRLSNSIYEYALLLIPTASILSFNDYLETYDNLEGERSRTTSRSEVLSSSLSWHDMFFKDRMLNDKKDLLRENNRKVISDQSSKTVILDENNKDDLRLRYSLIYSDQIGEINIRTILTREALMEKAIEAIDKCISLTTKTNTDLLMFHSQLYFEMGALKTTSITSSSESHMVNTIKQHDKKKTQKSEVENLSESMIDENRQRMLKEVDELFTVSIVSLNKVLEAKPSHMVAMAVLGEVYFFWSRSKFGKESDKHIQNAIEIWTRLLNFPQLTLPYNITLDHISKMISFALEIRKGIIICDGMGLKQGKLRKSWTERYFLLTIEYFGYFQIKTTKSLKKKKMKNTIPSDTIDYVKQNTDDKFTSNKNYPFCLEVVCKKRTFYVCYSSQEELDRWDAAFEYVILMNQIMSGANSNFK